MVPDGVGSTSNCRWEVEGSCYLSPHSHLGNLHGMETIGTKYGVWITICMEWEPHTYTIHSSAYSIHSGIYSGIGTTMHVTGLPKLIS